MGLQTVAKSRILAVDDTAANLIALEAVLGHKYEMLFAASGAEAIAVVETRTKIDLILMDLQMPGMDGYEAAARIQSTPQGANIPLVFITAIFGDSGHVKKGYAAGAIDYLTKPVDPEILRLKVGVYTTFKERFCKESVGAQ